MEQINSNGDIIAYSTAVTQYWNGLITHFDVDKNTIGYSDIRKKWRKILNIRMDADKNIIDTIHIKYKTIKQ
jgi:hypothetical protein